MIYEDTFISVVIYGCMMMFITKFNFETKVATAHRLCESEAGH